MKAVYYATKHIDICFVCNDLNLDSELYRYADRFLDQKGRNYDPSRITFKKLKSLDEVPENLRYLDLYGDISQEGQTPNQFFATKDPEYQEYLRLKKKFEK